MSVRRRRCLDQSLVVSVPQPRGSGANLIQIRRRSGKRPIENQKHSSTPRSRPVAKPPLGNLLATVCLDGKPNDLPHEFPVRFSVRAVDQLRLPCRLVTSQARTGNSGRRNSKEAERTSPIRNRTASDHEKPRSHAPRGNAPPAAPRRSQCHVGKLFRRRLKESNTSSRPRPGGEPAEPAEGRLPDLARVTARSKTKNKARHREVARRREAALVRMKSSIPRRFVNATFINVPQQS